MERKKLSDISWNVTEEEYRADPAWSYSTLSRFNREGFNSLDKLFSKVESSSLLFGSCVDSIITGGQEEFDSRFFTVDLPKIPDNILEIVKSLYSLYGNEHKSLYSIDDKTIIAKTEEVSYQLNWKPETRAKVIREKGEGYYRYLFVANGRTIVTTQVYNEVENAVKALKESDATRYYFAENNPFEDVERFYQLKFKGTFEGINYRCMADLIIVDHENMTIYPIDLKTSSHKEWDFYQSFIDWGYHIQARLYWRLIKQTIEKDDYFKNFTLADYKFIVVNKESLTPLVWSYRETKTEGLLHYGKNNQIECPDPFVLGKLLTHYQNEISPLPVGIDRNNTNDLTTWLKNM